MEENVYTCMTGDISIPTHMTIPQYALEKSSTIGHKAAYVNGITGETITFSQVARLVRNVAAGLSRLNVRQGDVVMLLLPNHPEYPVLYLGIITLGAIVTTANPNYTGGEIAKQLQDSRTKLVITASELLGKVESSGLPCVVVGRAPPGTISASALFHADATEAPTVTIHKDDTCILPYSSGTTGAAKGVMLSHFNLISNVEQHLGGSQPRLGVREEDVILGLLPMFHIYAISALLLMGLRAGATVVVMPRFDLIQMLELIQKREITVAFLVPPIILGLSKLKVAEGYDLRSLRMIISGAAPLDASLEAAFNKRFPHIILAQGYGMTESSPTTLLSRALAANRGPQKLGSAGVLLPNTRAKIVDTVSGRSLPPHESGELCIQGPQVMRGYLNNAEATAATIDREGWLHTGDVAFVDDDGEFFIVDRLKELIKYKGFQVPPAELEGLLLSNPLILDAAVVPQRNDEAGEVPVAFVVRAGGEKSVSEDDIKSFVAKQVAPYKRLHRVIIVDAIPKSAAGKILRRELRSKL